MKIGEGQKSTLGPPGPVAAPHLHLTGAGTGQSQGGSRASANHKPHSSTAYSRPPPASSSQRLLTRGRSS